MARHQLYDWLTDWLIDWFIDRLTDWLIDWLVVNLPDALHGTEPTLSKQWKQIAIQKQKYSKWTCWCRAPTLSGYRCGWEWRYMPPVRWLLSVITEPYATSADEHSTVYAINANCTGWSKKTVPQFYFCDNFRKCTPILTIFSLLEQEIHAA